MPDEDFRRRKTDRMNSADEIAEMIRNEENSKDRAFLLVMQSLNNSQIASTESLITLVESVKDIGARFNAHIIDDGKANAVRKNAWRWIAGISSTAQVIVVAVVTLAWHDFSAMAEMLSKHEIRLQLVEQARKPIEPPKGAK